MKSKNPKVIRGVRKNRRIGRRAILRGAGGIGISLPFLEVMRGNSANAQGGDIPKRYVVMVAGTSLGNGPTHVNETYVPEARGFDYDLKPALASLGGGTLPSGASYASVKDKVSVVTGLKIPWARENGGSVPAGGRPNNHHETMVSPLLSGVRTPEGGGKCYGATSDQVVLDAVGRGGSFDSLQYCVQPSSYLGGGGITDRAIISYADGGGIGERGESIRPQTSPRLAWEELTTGFASTSTDPAVVEAAALEARVRGSVVDLVRQQADTLQSRLGRADERRLSDHFDELRDLELRLDALGSEPIGACTPLDDPGPDPRLSGNRRRNADGNFPYDVSLGYSNEDLRAEVFMRLIHMAFVCDLTRSVAIQFTHFHSWMNVNELLGHEDDIHGLGHSGRLSTPRQADVLAWHYKHFASLVDTLGSTTEADGSTLLDHSALVFTHEGGYGLDPADMVEERSHSTENMACLIAGNAGGLVPGQHVRKVGAHPAQVLISAMTAVGQPDERLGEVTGVIPELFAEPS